MIKKICQTIYDQTSFIWCVLYPYFVKHSLDDALELVALMYEQGFDFLPEIEEILLKLWETGNIEYFVDIAKVSLQKKLFDTEKYIFIVAVLFELEKITINDAAQFLNIELLNSYDVDLDNRVKHVIDVAWLVNEDSKDNIMFADDDSILADALKGVINLFD